MKRVLTFIGGIQCLIMLVVMALSIRFAGTPGAAIPIKKMTRSRP